MKAETFKTISRRYAGVVGRRDNVEVVFSSGDRASTNGKVIIVPDLPYGTMLNEQQVKVYGGYLDHEAAHVRESEFNPAKVGGTVLPARVDWITNLIEDIRVERIQIGRYPGMKAYLDALCHEVDTKSVESGIKNKVTGAIYKECWEAYREVKTPIYVTLESLGLQQVKDLLTEIPGLKSTKDSHSLAMKIVAVLKEELEKMQQTVLSPIAQSKGQSYGLGGGKAQAVPESDESEGEESEEQESDEQDEESSEAGSGAVGGEAEGENLNKSEESEEPSQEGGKSEQDSAGHRQADGESRLTEADLKEAVEDAKNTNLRDERLEAFLEAVKGEIDDIIQKERSNRKIGDKILPPLNPKADKIMERPVSCRRRYIRAVSRNTARLQRELVRVLQARDKRAWRRDMDEGELNDEALYSVKAGSKRIYQQKRDRRAMNTAVEVMIDCSASMSDDIVKAATEVLTGALNAVSRLKFEIAGFYADSWCGDGSVEVGARVGRANVMHVIQFKGFEESVSSARKYLEGIETRGYTPLGDAYAVGMENLIVRKERKKILLVVTDGSPEFQIICKEHNDFLLMKKIKLTCDKYNILTVGLGVGLDKDTLQPYFNLVEVVRGTSDLVDSMLKLAERLV